MHLPMTNMHDVWVRKALKTATLEGRSGKQELKRFLLQYRTTPHCTTVVPPSKGNKGKIPVLNKKKVVNRYSEARANETKRKERNREYTGQRKNTRVI